MSDITGRDRLIITRALAMAIAIVPHLPEHAQAPSDRDDMLAILRAMLPPEQVAWLLDEAAMTVSSVEDSYRTDKEA